MGAFSCLTVDSTNDDPEILRQSVDKRVFFAGEATIYKYQGTLQGAYITGACTSSQPRTDCRRFGSLPPDGDSCCQCVYQAARQQTRSLTSRRFEANCTVVVDNFEMRVRGSASSITTLT